ncbi:MAG: divergent polysaccharide deacetylase family protein [Candidatus Baltobacteraceae bacterium]
MRTWLSLIVITFSLAALGSGYLTGRSSVAPAQTVAAQAPVAIDARIAAQVQFARSLHGAHSFVASEDAPVVASEDAVVSNNPANGRLGDDARVAIVIENAGRSLKLEAGFLNLPIPLTFAIDPAADEASEVAAAAFDRGKSVYLLLAVAPSETQGNLQKELAALRSKFPSMSGVAVHFDDEYQEREAAALALALRGPHLRVLDLTGVDGAAQRALRTGGILSRRRDVTIDNHDDPAYVRFMLAQAVQVARGRGTAVIVAHPYPGSLGALGTLVENSARDGVNFTVL